MDDISNKETGNREIHGSNVHHLEERNARKSQRAPPAAMIQVENTDQHEKQSLVKTKKN